MIAEPFSLVVDEPDKPDKPDQPETFPAFLAWVHIAVFCHKDWSIYDQVRQVSG
jgi:hypothetical protein